MTKIIRDFTKELQRRLTQNLPFIQVVIGPRQVGKSTGVQHIGEQWVGQSIYVTADLPSPPGPDWITEQWLRARNRGPNTLLIIDEVSKISAWSEVTKQLFDEERRRKEPLKVVILGSASWNLQTGLNDSLAGRFELLPVYHWDFRECQKAFNWDLDTFLSFGGYPAPAALINETKRWQSYMRDSIIEPVISRDLLFQRSISKPALFRQTLELVLKYPAQELSLQKLLGQLQDSGNTTTIKGYLELLESGFIIRTLAKFSTRSLTTKSSSPKFLPLACALISSFNDPKRITEDPEWRGRVFESAVGAALSRRYTDLFYWRDGNNEVDFVIRDDNRIIAVEVKSSRKRGTSGLQKFLKAFPDAEGVIVDEHSGVKILQGESL